MTAYIMNMPHVSFVDPNETTLNGRKELLLKMKLINKAQGAKPRDA